MKQWLISLLLLLSLNSFAQSAADRAILQKKEDSLKTIAHSIIWAEDAADRFRADSLFTRTLVRALVTPHSFLYPFDSVVQISRIYAPDSAFRIFSWQVIKDENVVRRHGAIQIKTTDGKLKLFPLVDKTDAIDDPINQSFSTDTWIGSIYYKILLNQFQGKKLYTLFGYDENTALSTMKRLEVLQFDEHGKPIFGASPFFSFAEDSIKKPAQVRYWIEYKKDGNARLQYDEEMQMILIDHLIPENGEAEKKYTYIPDGDYEGFKWKNGQWVHIDKVFTFALQDGQAPVPVPFKEEKIKMPSSEKKAPIRKKGN